MKRTTIFIDDGDERDLKALAERKGEPMASLVREAIADYLVRQGSEVRELSFLAAGRSGRSDVAERHEELLWRDLAPHAAAKPAVKRAPRPRRRGSRSGR